MGEDLQCAQKVLQILTGHTYNTFLLSTVVGIRPVTSNIAKTENGPRDEVLHSLVLSPVRKS